MKALTMAIIFDDSFDFLYAFTVRTVSTKSLAPLIVAQDKKKSYIYVVR
jgi:hypothetical protein